MRLPVDKVGFLCRLWKIRFMAAISNKRIRVRDNSAGWLSGRRVGFLFQERIKTYRLFAGGVALSWSSVGGNTFSWRFIEPSLLTGYVSIPDTYFWIFSVFVSVSTRGTRWYKKLHLFERESYKLETLFSRWFSVDLRSDRPRSHRNCSQRCCCWEVENLVAQVT